MQPGALSLKFLRYALDQRIAGSAQFRLLSVEAVRDWLFPDACKSSESSGIESVKLTGKDPNLNA